MKYSLKVSVAVVDGWLTVSSVPISIIISKQQLRYTQQACSMICTFSMHYVVAIAYLWGAGCGFITMVTCCHGHTLDCIRNRKGRVSVREYLQCAGVCGTALRATVTLERVVSLCPHREMVSKLPQKHPVDHPCHQQGVITEGLTREVAWWDHSDVEIQN